jgi:hypothetical protein
LVVAQITVNAESVTFTTVKKRTSPGDATVIVGVGSMVAVEVLVGEGTGVLVGVDVAVLDDVGVAEGTPVTDGDAVAVPGTAVTVADAVGSRMVKLSESVALTVREAPLAATNAGFVNVMVVDPAVRPLSASVRIWTVPVAPDELTDVNDTAKAPAFAVHVPVTFAVTRLQEMS